MKTIKNIALLVSVCVAVLMAAGCDNNKPPVDGPIIEFPDNRSVYSDVSTVYWDYRTDDCSNLGATGEVVKVAGWIVRPGGDVEKMDCNAFYLANEPDQIKINGAILITAPPEVAKQIKMRHNDGLVDGNFDREPDIRQKCYITGVLIMEIINENGRSVAVPSIKITEVGNFKVEDEVLPADVKPIDWKNYNDVYTIYWNYRNNTQEGPTGKILKAEGWVAPISWQHEINPHYFKLANIPYGQIQTQMDWYEKYTISIETASPEVAEQLKIKFEDNDLNKKCYITGELIFETWDGAPRYSTHLVIVITDANAVIFESSPNY